MTTLWEQPQLHLAKPQKDYYTVLTGVKNFKSKIYLNNVSEISFRIYEYENGKRNELYDELDVTQLIEAFELDWFQIKTVNESCSDVEPVAYKDVTCKSLEDDLITKTVYSIDGVFSLYDVGEPSKSILHIVTNDNSWNIGYISSSLMSLYRVLSIDSARVYSLLTGEIAKSFNCIFTFNKYYKTINAYSLDEIGEFTDLVINNRNLLKSWSKSSDKDKIVTKMRVLGGTSTSGIQFDIRQVNFGSVYISNYDYFKPRMSAGLVTALNNQQAAYDTHTTSYNSNIDSLKTYNAQLNTLNNELIEITSQMSAQDLIINTSLKKHYGNPPISTDADYATYQGAVSQLAILNTQKYNKETEITNKKNQITSVENTLNTLSSYVENSNFFTTGQLEELDSFTYCGNDYVDETFIETDETTATEVIEMKLQLMSNANQELLRVCKPQPEFKATLRNLWSIRDEKDCLISYDEYRDKFKLGNLVTVMINDNEWTTIRIIGIELDYDNPEDAEIIFSTKNRLDDSIYILGELQAQASRAYSAIQLNKYSYDKAASNTASFKAFQTGVFNNTLNKMISDDHAQVESGAFGIKLKPWIESENKYGLNQMWLNPYRMIFTDDGWVTANSAFGLLSLNDGTQKMGINTDYLIGRISITENTYIQNEAGNYTFDKYGFLATATSGANTYQVGINPSTPNQIFRIAVNGTNRLYVDTTSNRLVFSGALSAATGTFSGQITGGSLNINNNCIIDSSGHLTAVGASLSGSFSTTGVVGGITYTTTIQNGYIQTNLVNSDAIFVGNQGMNGTRIYAGSTTFMEEELISSNLFVGATGNFSNLNINGSSGLSVGNIVSLLTSNNITVPNAAYAISSGSASSTSSCSTGYLTLSGGTLLAPNGSLWIGQNTVKANTIEQTSSINYKKNINLYVECALNLICDTKIKTYNYINEEDESKLHLGMIVEESPSVVISTSGESLDIGAVGALAWKAIQEQQLKIKELESEIILLKNNL